MHSRQCVVMILDIYHTIFFFWSIGSSEQHGSSCSMNMNVNVISLEKLSASARRRFETQVTETMHPMPLLLSAAVPKVNIVPLAWLFIAGCVDERVCRTVSRKWELGFFPLFRQLIIVRCLHGSSLASLLHHSFFPGVCSQLGGSLHIRNLHIFGWTYLQLFPIKHLAVVCFRSNAVKVIIWSPSCGILLLSNVKLNVCFSRWCY